MVRLLLTVFFVGLVVSCGCWAIVEAMGGGDGLGRYTRHGDGHWTFDKGGDIGVGPADNDQTLTRDLAWAGAQSLDINVPADIHYTQGPVVKVTASGPSRLVNALEVQDNRIVFKDNGRYSGKQGGLTLTITAPDVRKFQLNGAAKLDIANYAQDDLDLQVNGAAKVDAAGSAKSLHLQLNGAGQGDMRHLVNSNADVQINGAGQATLATTERADVEINGVGNVRLLNRPKSLTQSKHGFGSIDIGPDGDGDDDSDAAKPAPPAPKAPGKAAA